MSEWQLVPVEPTREMEDAWNNGKTSTYQRFREKWINALDAAPAPAPSQSELVKAARELFEVKLTDGCIITGNLAIKLGQLRAALDKVRS